jgi:hypothetical protein
MGLGAKGGEGETEEEACDKKQERSNGVREMELWQHWFNLRIKNHRDTEDIKRINSYRAFNSSCKIRKRVKKLQFVRVSAFASLLPSDWEITQGASHAGA